MLSENKIQEKPIYRILSVAGFFGPDSHLYKEGEEIYFEGEPNEDMEPLNQPARERMEAFFNKLEEAAKQLAKKAGVPYTGRPRTLEAAVELSTLAARRASTINGDGGISLMGDKTDRSDVIGRAEAMPTPETGAKAPKRSGGGTLSLNKPQPLSKVPQTLA